MSLRWPTGECSVGFAANAFAANVHDRLGSFAVPARFRRAIRGHYAVLVSAALFAMVFAPAPLPALAADCVGDCDTDGSVTVDELVTLVSIPLGVRATAMCDAGDGDDDGEITIDEVLLAVSSALNGCPEPPRLDVWLPATVPFDPECRTGCTERERTVPLAHSEAQLRIRTNPAVDDAIAQWGDCLESVLACFERDGALDPCVEQAACPDECKELFRQGAATAEDEDARVDVLEAVLIDRDAPCRPAAGVPP